MLERTPHQEIISQRIERVTSLVIETDMPLKQVSQIARFERQEYMSVVFRRVTGTPPRKFRRERRAR